MRLPSSEDLKPRAVGRERPRVSVGSSQVRTESTAADAASARAPAAWMAGLCPWASTSNWSMYSAVSSTPLFTGAAWPTGSPGGKTERITKQVILKRDGFMADLERRTWTDYLT